MMTARLTFVHALSPLHAGIGQGAGVIDLPIARETATGLPFLPGSSLKGTLRARCTGPNCTKVFGPEASDIDPNSNYASSIQFSDQRLLLLSMRSLAGTFAWVTSPYVLRRLIRDIKDVQSNPPADIPKIEEGQCSIVETGSKIAMDNRVYLEDLDLIAQLSRDATTWANWIGQRVFPSDAAWQRMLLERFCIVQDDVFNFMIDTATEITARIKLEEKSKTVQQGGLWYEEALPTETILSGLAIATPVEAAGMTAQQVFSVINGFMGQTVQLGGKATVGRGMCRVQLGQ
jgi:CRISPR-associated protein Cmr4